MSTEAFKKQFRQDLQSFSDIPFVFMSTIPFEITGGGVNFVRNCDAR